MTKEKKQIKNKRSMLREHWDEHLLSVFSLFSHSSAHSEFHWVEEPIPYFNSIYSHSFSYCFSLLMLAQQLNRWLFIEYYRLRLDLISFDLLFVWIWFNKQKQKQIQKQGWWLAIHICFTFVYFAWYYKDEVITYHLFLFFFFFIRCVCVSFSFFLAHFFTFKLRFSQLSHARCLISNTTFETNCVAISVFYWDSSINDQQQQNIKTIKFLFNVVVKKLKHLQR